ncbi:MAG: fused MFS/spermidine synthase [Sedimentisphaerales bacterium]|nr:fused MFS/spermidine synthase [Sedimentisphaerales bacterium]
MAEKRKRDDLARMSAIRGVVTLLFLISGASGLVYEVTWTRAFGVVFGNTVFAVSTVLTVFMLGLAVGSWLFGRIADGSGNPLRLYGVIELLVGLYAFAFPAILRQTDVLYTWIYRAFGSSFYQLSLIRFIVSIVILAGPAALMGGTLPVLSRLWAEPAWFGHRKAQPGKSVGLLYAVNTFGAVAGAFFSGYFLVRLLGVSNTIYAAAAANVLIGLVALVLSGALPRRATDAALRSDSRTKRKKRGKGKPQKAEAALAQPVMDDHRRARGAILAVMAISGFCALALEVVWTRVLVFVLGTSVYAFACVLTTFILGLAIGSVIAGHLIVPRLQRPVFAIGVVEFLLAGSVLTSIGVLEYLWHIDLKVVYWIGGSLTFVGDTVTHFLDAAVVVLVPTILMGIAFPIAVKVYAPSWETVGKRVGALYACNTIGCVVGSFAAGFLMVPWLGMRNSILLIVAIQFLLGVSVLAFLSEARRMLVGVPSAVIAVASVASAFIAVPEDVFLRTIKTYHYPSKVLFMKDGVTGTVTVHDIPDGDRIIAVDGVNVAGVDFMLRTTQMLQGYAPLFVHRGPKKVLQIGFGSGETCGIGVDFDKSPDYEYTICEICPDVFKAGQYFKDINRGVYENPRLRKVIMDGKNFVKLTDEKFDIIMNDSTYPGTTGSSALYTYDHFMQCRERLNEGGVLSCWVPIDLRPEDFQVIVRSFQAAMPHCSLWMVNNCVNKHAVIMGTMQPMRIDFGRIRELVARPPIAADLAVINILSAYDFLDSLVVGEEGLRAIGGDGPLNTDDTPSLEFGASVKRDVEGCWIAVLKAMVENHTPPSKYIVGIGSGTEAESVSKMLEQYYRGTGHALRGMLGILQGDPDMTQQAFTRAAQVNPLDRDVEGCIQEMYREIEAFEAAIERTPNNAILRWRLAQRYMLLAEYDKAIDQYLVYYNLSSGDPKLQARAQNNIGVCHKGMKRFDDAVGAFSRAVELDRGLVQSYLGLAAVYQQSGEPNKAVEILLRAVQVSDQANKVLVYIRLGQLYTEMKDYQSALDYADKTLELLPPQSQMWNYISERKVLLRKALQEAQGAPSPSDPASGC